MVWMLYVYSSRTSAKNKKKKHVFCLHWNSSLKYTKNNHKKGNYLSWKRRESNWKTGKLDVFTTKQHNIFIFLVTNKQRTKKKGITWTTCILIPIPYSFFTERYNPSNFLPTGSQPYIYLDIYSTKSWTCSFVILMILKKHIHWITHKY